MYRRTKFHNRKIIVDGETFDSKLEYERFLHLCELQRCGHISNLSRQVSFELIPAQYAQRRIQLKTKVKYKEMMVERSVSYIADFVYTDSDNQRIIEDTKGFHTPEYIIKRKLMRLNGNVIHEITQPTQRL